MEHRAWPFIGRSRELRALVDLVAADTSVILAGPAGVGKTQLMREVVRRRPHRPALWITAAIESTPRWPDLPDLAGGRIVVDDIHLLDDDSATVIASLVAARRISMLATLRTPERSPDAVTALWKDDHVVRIDVGPLTRVELDEILREYLPGPVDVEARRAFWEMSDGSPLVLRELVRSALDDGVLDHVDGGWRLIDRPRTGRLDEMLCHRLDALDPEARRTVELVALGSPLPMDLVVSAVGLDVLGVAEASGMIESTGDGLRRDVVVGHPVFADIVAGRLGAARTAIRFRELLEMLASTPMRRTDDVLRAATWEVRSRGATVNADVALAARRALYTHDHWLAVELASRVVGESAGAAHVLTQALSQLGEHERAMQVTACTDSRERDMDRVNLACQRSVTLFWGLGDEHGAEQVLLDCERRLTDELCRRKLRAERAIVVAAQGRLEFADSLVDDLLDDDATPQVFVSAVTAASIVRMLDGRTTDAVELARHGYAVGDAAGDDPDVADPSIHLVAETWALGEAGAILDAEQIARTALDVSVESGHRSGQAWFSLVLGRTLMLRGRSAEARRRFDEAAAVFGWLRNHGLRRWAFAGVVQAAAIVGDAAGAERAWTSLNETPASPASMLDGEITRAAAWLLVVEGDRRGALRRLSTLADELDDSGQLTLAGAVVHDIVRLGGSVATQLGSRIGSCQGALAPIRAALTSAAASRNADDARAAATAFAELGADGYAAEAFATAAELFASTNGPEAVRCRARAASILDATGSGRPITLELPTTTFDLTDREREIFDLAVQGWTNREIATHLVVSVRTVENHLHRCYRKLGVGGRHELRRTWATAGSDEVVVGRSPVDRSAHQTPPPASGQ